MKDLLLKIRDKFVAFGMKFVAFFVKVGHFFRCFPHNFVTFWKNFGIGFYRFFRYLPQNTKHFFQTMTKDKAIDLLIGTGAVVVWSMPLAIVLYVLIWFLSK